MKVGVRRVKQTPPAQAPGQNYGVHQGLTPGGSEEERARTPVAEAPRELQEPPDIREVGRKP